MDEHVLAELLFPNVLEEPEIWETRYPPRKLPDGACVTRFAPSPTGFLHFGALYGALVDERLARQSKGRFLLRIEDTDEKRTVPNGDEMILSGLAAFGILFDEGAIPNGDLGNYGPYRQRQRVNIYQTIAKQLVREGKAYPCFCTEKELESMREQQAAEKANFGYYGRWARYRDCGLAMIRDNLNEGRPWVLRFKSTGNQLKSVNFHDLVKGDLTFPENDQDHVLLKSDGVPTYHFAHVVDDHFMRITHVIRGDEWLATLPLHIQLFDACGFARPQYAHTATIMKHDDGGKRKLSKRKDPEADVRYFKKAGYPAKAVIEYLMTLLNSDYEEWRTANPKLPYTKFPFRLAKLSVSGMLFDDAKLYDVSKNIISTMTAEEVRRAVMDWADEYHPTFAKLIGRDAQYARAIFAIGRGGDKPRKDFATWSEVPEYISFFFDEHFAIKDFFPSKISIDERRMVLMTYAASFDLDCDNAAWFDKVKELAAEAGFTADNRQYKENPGLYKGTVGDYVMLLRVAVCGRQNAPDLYSVMKLLGKDRVVTRLMRAVELNE